MENSEANTQLQQEKMVTGTAWLSLANIISRLLGAVYIIPWYALMAPYGDRANTLYAMGYNVYALFLLLSTIGIPVAVAKEVARYNALDDENMAYRLVRQMLVFMAALGVLMAIILYFASPALAAASGGTKALIPVMRSLALAILILPFMSVIRGYFQGLNEMKAFAVSQIYEQIVRVVWMLVTAFVIMKLGSKNWQSAVTESTTAAFIGAIASTIVLIVYLVREGHVQKILFPGPSVSKLKPIPLLVQTIIAALPFVVTGSAIQIFKLIDQMTFVNVMLKITSFPKAQLNDFFAYFSANTDKITMILIAVALTLGDVGLPLITAAFTKRHKKEVAYLISYNLQFFTAFMLPAVMGVVILAKPIYTLFYTVPNALQIQLFVYAALQSFILTLLALAWLFLQAMQHSRDAMRYFIITLVIKVIIQVPCIFIFHTFGPLMATTIAFLVGTYLSMKKIKQVSHYKTQTVWRGVFAIGMLTSIMVLFVMLIYTLLQLIFRDSPSKLIALITLVISGGAGFYLYVWCAAKLGLLEKFMGERGTSLRRKLHL
ncbi:MAG: polysaccharide biosynthesis protein [Streptococcaceae bacterium]|jgi:O-antigen/teichoic acid export membrane protein|nr:polysaccharide biosynthesis protein [Streptococcaceae bacterium]